MVAQVAEVGRWRPEIQARKQQRSGLRRFYRPLLEDLEGRIVPTTPSVLSINRLTPLGPETNATSVNYAVTFNESVTGVAAGDFQVITDGSVQAASPVAVSGSGASYTVQINGIHGSGDLGLNLIDNGLINSGGVTLGSPSGVNGSFQGQTYSIAQSFPYVVSINRAAPAGPTTNASTVSFTVTFSEPVTGVNPTDFQVVTTGTVGTTLTQVTPSGPASVYTVTISGITGNGTLGLNLVDNGSIRDLAGNPLVQESGAASFGLPQAFVAGDEPVSVAVADLNGDGIPDLAVAASGGNDAGSVLLGNGNGTFQAQQTFVTDGRPAVVSVADVNGDSIPDLVVATTDYVDDVLLGNGNGTFQAQQGFDSGPSNDLFVADVNGDGKVDLVVTSAYNHNDTVGVLLGNGNGTFQAEQTFATGSGPQSVSVADLNGDGKPDLAVVNFGSNTVSLLLGNGNGTFQAQETNATALYPTDVVVADVNGDGKVDLVLTCDSSPNDAVCVLLGNGNGTFQSQRTFATGDNPVSVSVADLNGDGKPDLAVANIGGSTLSLLLGNGNGTFQVQQTLAAGALPIWLAVGDLSDDGRPDLVVGSDSSFTVSVLLNTENGNFMGQVYTIDTIDPYVESINRTTPAGPSTSASTVSFTVTFSEPVTGVNPTDFLVVTSGTVGTTLTQVTPPARLRSTRSRSAALRATARWGSIWLITAPSATLWVIR